MLAEGSVVLCGFGSGEQSVARARSSSRGTVWLAEEVGCTTASARVGGARTGGSLDVMREGLLQAEGTRVARDSQSLRTSSGILKAGVGKVVEPNSPRLSFADT
eukprot:COSAG02_NODE_1276_length_13504_cov_15.182618_5_plen_104_part_00